ncbi:MAG: class I adenylate-forming enzyme family protein [Candidatus Acidiferrales bacterium]
MPESAIVQAVRAQAARVPDRVAVVAGETTLRYGGLERQASAAAAQIAQKARGDFVGLLLPNTLDVLPAWLGALWAGKTVALLPIIAPPPLLKLMAAEAKLDTVLTNAELAPRLTEIGLEPLLVNTTENAGRRDFPLLPRAHPAAVLLYTSGTTGRPKAVALSDANLLANIEGCIQGVGFGETDIILAVLPLFHAMGLTVTCVLPLSLGGKTVLLERFTPRGVLQAVGKHRITCMVGVPSMYRLMAKESSSVDVSSLRLCISGAERLAESIAGEFEARLGLRLYQGYGATEASPVVACNAPAAYRAGTVGRPLPNLKMTLRQHSEAMPPGQPGEVCVAGPNVMLGYHNHAVATAEKIVAGELRTGDLGVLDADGFLRIVGRADDLIKVAGEKIYPAEVERALEQIEGVEEAVVMGVADEKHGTVLRAFVQPSPGARLTEAGLRAACRDHLEAIKIPRSVTLVEQFPRTATGKADRRALAARPAS